jgi:hypothetical protein
VARAQGALQLRPERDRLLAVCGTEGAGLRFLAGLPLAGAGWSLPLEEQQQSWQFQVATAHLSPAQMPPEWAGLQPVDLLVTRDAGWMKLEPAQRRAVRQWVEMGGRLLMCGEDPAGFADAEGRRLLPVEPTGRRPRPELTAFPLPDRASIRAPSGQVMTVAARPRPDAAILLREAGAPLLVARPQGFGVVLWLGFDPFRVPPPTLDASRALWSFLIGHATGPEITTPAFPRLTDVPGVKDLPAFLAPSRWTIASFGIAYALLFGPINILLLRRLRRTVRAWLLMPALSLGLTGGVLALGYAWGNAQIVFHTTSVLEATAGSGTAREQNLAALFSPTNHVFRLAIDDPAPTIKPLTEDGNYPTAADPTAPGPPNRSTPLILAPEFRDGDLCRWDRIGLTLWTIQLFETQRAVDLEGEVRLELDDRLTGRVINQTPRPLRDAYLQLKSSGWRCALGEVPPGGVRRVAPGAWRKRRQADEEANPYAVGRYRYPERPGGGPTYQYTREPGSEAADLINIAGSLLMGSPRRAEVVLVAHVPDLMLPIRFSGVHRSPAPGLSEDAILLVRQPVSPTARPAGTAP